MYGNIYKCNTTYQIINHSGGNIKMKINNTKVGVYINEIKMIRPGNNFGRGEHDLNVDWGIEYTKNEDKITEYICTLAAIGGIHIKLAIHGYLECEDHNEILEESYNDLSPLILDKCMNAMINILNATRNTTVTIKTDSELYLSCVPGEL